mmetsp:Transcript_6261/g.16967  ORF Transcript_6261/g.16967 Transcript_6261/m.16967 type:complete len:278 (-) Transcript_6261:110-943(-)
MSTQLHGMSELIRRLEAIAEACGEKTQKDAAHEKDEFLRVKRRVYTLLESSRGDIHDREALLKKRGNCFETIQKGHAIRQSLDELRQSMPRLQELHKKAQGKRSAGRKQEELQARYKDIRILKRHVDEVHDLFLRSGAEGAGAGSEPAAQLLGLRSAAYAPASGENSKRGLTDEERSALEHMKRRDEELDKEVAELGLVVERLDPLARQIGISADHMRQRAENMNEDVAQAEKDMQLLNKKITEVMRYEKNTNCCCQMVLGIALLCCVGFVFNQIGI